MKADRKVKQLTISLAVFLLAVLAAACGKDSASHDVIVAEVGGRTIKLREVTDYITSLYIDYPSAADEYIARQRYLDRLIENELLVIGGYARTLDADIGILERVDEEKDKFLLDELYRTEVIDKVTVDEAEIREVYSHWFDRVHFRHIVVIDKDRADSLLTQLQKGADFGDVAEKFSLDQASRYRAGDPGREFSYNELPAELARLAFSAEKDKLVGPVKSDLGWHIMKVMETRQLESRDYEDVRPVIESSLRRIKQQDRRNAHLEEIERKTNITFDPATLSLWREKYKQIIDTSSLPTDRRPAVPVTSLSQQEMERVVYTFGPDYKVGLMEFCQALESRSPFDRPDPDDDEQLRRIAFQTSLFDILSDEALRLRLDESPIYKERVQDFLESMMAERMRNSVLARGITVTESETRAFYDAHPDSFITPASYHCREIMVFKKEDVERIEAQLRSSANFEQLARAQTERAGMKGKGGDLGWITPKAWPDFYEAASKLRPGEWAGPLKVSDQVSFIQLIESRPPQQRTYEEVATEIFESIQRARRDSVFAVYVDSMRVQYPVTVKEDALKSGLAGASGQVDSVRSN